jgi:hypothetical protein
MRKKIFIFSFIFLISFYKLNFSMDGNQIKYSDEDENNFLEKKYPNNNIKWVDKSEWYDNSENYSMQIIYPEQNIKTNPLEELYEIIQNKKKLQNNINLSKKQYYNIIKNFFENNQNNENYKLSFYSTFYSFDKKKIKYIFNSNNQIKKFYYETLNTEINKISYNTQINSNILVEKNNIKYYFNNFFDENQEKSLDIANKNQCQCIKNFQINNKIFIKSLFISQIIPEEKRTPSFFNDNFI